MYLLPKDLEQAMYDFEDRAFLGWDEPGCDSVDRSPERSELLYDAIEADDAAFYDRYER